MNPLNTATFDAITSLPKANRAAVGCLPDYLGNSFVYTVISPRDRGLSVGVNMNPDKFCNFNCAYCEVNRNRPPRATKLDVNIMVEELERTLMLAQAGRLREHPRYQNLPDELLKLRHVALSGDGEPTLVPDFFSIIEALIHLRAHGPVSFFNLVLITNASGLDRPEVKQGLRLFAFADEVWAKLEAGTQGYMNRVNQPNCQLETILDNILNLARERPVIIQSLFPSISGQSPLASEIETYAQHLKVLKAAGANIPLVQIYSATRPTLRSECGHLPLRTLCAIAQRVREVSGLKAEVF